MSRINRPLPSCQPRNPHHLLNDSNLARDGDSTNISRGAGKSDLGFAAADKSGHDLPTSVDPLREFFGVNDVRVLESIEALDERGRSNIAGANVESPGDESTVLVLVKDNWVGDGVGDGVLETLFVEDWLAAVHRHFLIFTMSRVMKYRSGFEWDYLRQGRP